VPGGVNSVAFFMNSFNKDEAAFFPMQAMLSD